MQQELPFSLTDLKGRTSLKVGEVAELLRCTRKHVGDLIETGELIAINIGHGKTRMCARIPVESFRDFVLRGMTGDITQSPLRHLPTQSLIHWHKQLSDYLRRKGVRL